MERLSELLRYAEQDSRDRASSRPGVCAFVAHHRERLAGLRCDEAALVVVLEGSKELIAEGWSQTFRPGQAFVVPPGWEGDVVNEPADRTGVYRSLMLSFPALLVRRALRAYPVLSTPARSEDASRSGFGVKLAPPLEDALLHTARAKHSRLSRLVLEHRVMEVLIQLVEQRVWWLQPLASDPAQQVRRAIRMNPGRAWTVAAVAQILCCSPATFRRRLAAQKTSFRLLLQEERIQAANQMLKQPGARLTDVAAQCGYQSAHKFSRRYQALTGVRPVVAGSSRLNGRASL